MLATVSLSVADVAEMKPAHVKLLAVLLSFADSEGRCWPSLRKIADHAKETLSWVQRNVAEMVEAGHIRARRRLGRSMVYWIARRFVSPWRKPAGVPKTGLKNGTQQTSASPAGERDRPTAFSTGGSPANGTQGESKKDSQEDYHYEGATPRYAPSEADKAHVSDCVAEITETLTGRAPRREPAGDPQAYAAAIAKNRAEGWLANLASWVRHRFGVPAWVEALELCDVRLKAGSRAATPRDVRKRIDDLDRQYREDLKRGWNPEAGAWVAASA